MIRGARASGSDAAAAAAAQAVIEAGGGAVDAVIAGFFGAAGAHPGVLLGPVMALVAGFGAGGRAFDGRPAQPGRGAARPRGFVDEASIPDGARVAVPRSIAAIMLLSTHQRRGGLADLVKAGVAAAEGAGAKARAKLLRKVGAGGVLALRAPEVEGALLAVGGPVGGGALTAADIEEAAPAESDAAALAAGEGLTVYTPPFAGSADGGPAGGESGAEVVVACDARGVLAALAYTPARAGIPVPSLELTLGRDAVPVRRGVTRVAPGTLLPAAAPVAIAVGHGGFATAVGLPGRVRLDAADMTSLARGVTVETALGELREKVGGRAAVAVVTDGKTARVALS